jgi:hypothetical protein
MTLRHFYNKKRHFWAEDFPDFHDVFLSRVFALPDGQTQKALAAAGIIRKYRNALLKSVSKYSGERKHVINDLLRDIIKRSRELKLVTTDDEPVVTMHLSTYVTSLIMNYLYTGRFRGEKQRHKRRGHEKEA